MTTGGKITRHNFAPQLARLRQSMKKTAITHKPVEISRDNLELGEVIGKGTGRSLPRPFSLSLSRSHSLPVPPWRMLNLRGCLRVLYASAPNVNSHSWGRLFLIKIKAISGGIEL